MTTTAVPASAQEDTGKRVPGWRLVLDAFMAAPDRTLTNVELAKIPGVQAFHQRITDLGRKGYLVTPAVKVARGRYAYTLVGRIPVPGGDQWPHADSLPVESDYARRTAKVEAAMDALHVKRDALAKRGVAPTIRPPRATSEALAEYRSELTDVRTHLEDMGRAMDPGAGSIHPDTSVGELAGDICADIVREMRNRNEAWSALNVALGRPGGSLLQLAKAAAEALGDKPARARAPRTDRVTGPDLMRRALEHGEQPMHSAAIAKWVMAHGGADVYHGKTPAATMAAQLATSNKQGGPFVKTSPGCYGLREWDEDTLTLSPVQPNAAWLEA